MIKPSKTHALFFINNTYYCLHYTYHSLQRNKAHVNIKKTKVPMFIKILQNLIGSSFRRNGSLALPILQEIETDNCSYQWMHGKGLLVLIKRQPTVFYHLIQIFIPKTKPLLYFLK